jgi:hypothetical protein
MEEKKPMGCLTLFCVIVAALLFVFIALPAGCTIAGGLALIGLAKNLPRETAEVKSPDSAAGSTVSPVAPKPAQQSEASEIVLLLRERARWPMEVKVTKPTKAKISGAEFGLEAGRILTATAMSPEGQLSVTLAGEVTKIPFSDTDFVQRVAK